MNNQSNFELTPEEAIALYKELEHQFINYDSPVIYVLQRLSVYVKQYELDKRSSPPTQGV